MLERASRLRSNSTEPEPRLRRELRGSRLADHKFRRQMAIGNRIADFFCPAKGLIVEIDGDTHDRVRDKVMDTDIEARFGYRTIRFTNEDVMRNLDGVLVALDEALARQPDRWPDAARHHPPAPSSEEEGE
jgi:very-short-patch-repair endonuclease